MWEAFYQWKEKCCYKKKKKKNGEEIMGQEQTVDTLLLCVSTISSHPLADLLAKECCHYLFIPITVQNPIKALISA